MAYGQFYHQEPWHLEFTGLRDECPKQHSHGKHLAPPGPVNKTPILIQTAWMLRSYRLRIMWAFWLHLVKFRCTSWD